MCVNERETERQRERERQNKVLTTKMESLIHQILHKYNKIMRKNLILKRNHKEEDHTHKWCVCVCKTDTRRLRKRKSPSHTRERQETNGEKEGSSARRTFSKRCTSNSTSSRYGVRASLYAAVSPARPLPTTATLTIRRAGIFSPASVASWRLARVV